MKPGFHAVRAGNSPRTGQGGTQSVTAFLKSLAQRSQLALPGLRQRQKAAASDAADETVMQSPCL